MVPKKKKKSDRPEDDFFLDYGSWGDIGRYVMLFVALIFNFGFAVFVGYVLGEMADDTFLGKYDAIFTHIAMGLGFIGALIGTRKRIARFGRKQEELLIKRNPKIDPNQYSAVTLGVGFLAVFAGLCRISNLIYLVELRASGALWYLWADTILVGGGLLLVGVLVLLGRVTDIRMVRWAFLVPIAAGVPFALFSLAGGARADVAATLMLMTLGPLVGLYLSFFDKKLKLREA